MFVHLNSAVSGKFCFYLSFSTVAAPQEASFTKAVATRYKFAFFSLVASTELAFSACSVVVADRRLAALNSFVGQG